MRYSLVMSILIATVILIACGNPADQIPSPTPQSTQPTIDANSQNTSGTVKSASDSNIQKNPLWFFDVDDDEIQGIEVTHLSQVIRFNRIEGDVWVFRDPQGVPADYSRFDGITLILSSARTRRDFEAT